MATAVGVRVSSLAPRRSKVRFAPTSFYACGTKRRHPPAPLLLLSNRDPLRWARGWGRPTGGSFSFLERSVFIAPSTSEQSPLCSDVFLCLRHKKTSSARSLAPPLQPRPAALGSQLGPPCGCLFPGNFGFHRSFHVGAKSALLRRLFMPAAQKDVIRPLPGSSSPTATRCAGLAVGATLRVPLSLSRKFRFSSFLPRRGKVRFAPTSFSPRTKAPFACAPTFRAKATTVGFPAKTVPATQTAYWRRYSSWQSNGSFSTCSQLYSSASRQPIAW